MSQEARDRALIARHLRAAASAVNVKDWPAYLLSCADGHESGTSWYKPDGLDIVHNKDLDPGTCDILTAGDQLTPDKDPTINFIDAPGGWRIIWQWGSWTTIYATLYAPNGAQVAAGTYRP